MFYHCMDCSTSDSHTTIILMSYCSIDSETVKQPPLGVTVFTHLIFTVTLTVIVIWSQWEWVNFQRSEAVNVTSFACDKKDSFDLSVICMQLQLQDNGVILMKDQVWSVRMCWILSISGWATWQDGHIVCYREKISSRAPLTCLSIMFSPLFIHC